VLLNLLGDGLEGADAAAGSAAAAAAVVSSAAAAGNLAAAVRAGIEPHVLLQLLLEVR